MKCELWYGNVVSRSWRTWENNPNSMHIPYVVQYTTNVALMGKWYQNRWIRWHLSWLVPRLGLGPKRRGPTWEGPNHGPWYEVDLVSCRAESPFVFAFLGGSGFRAFVAPRIAHTFSSSRNPSTPQASLIRIIASSLLFSSLQCMLRCKRKWRPGRGHEWRARSGDSNMASGHSGSVDWNVRPAKTLSVTLRSCVLQFFFSEFNFDG